MRRVVRLLSIAGVCCGFLALALLAQPALLLFAPTTRPRCAARGLQICARTLLWLLGVKVTPSGFTRAQSHRPYLLVSNHQSYLDIIIIAAVFPTLFVSKKEVSRWPLLGWLARLGGTIFLKREDTQSNVRGVYRASRRLRAGSSVQVFPEGTTSDGSGVRPFNGLFFASAIRARAPVLPLTIKFQRVNGSAAGRELLDLVCWYGAADFARHFWQLLRIKSAEVSLMIHEPIKPSRRRCAKALATAVQNQIAAGFAVNEAVRLKGNEGAPAADFIVGALLYALLASNQNELVKESWPQSEHH